jgi:hypothetical protein
MGKAIAAAGSAGDPWITNLLNGGYIEGQAGHYVLNKLLSTAKFLALK